jgi:hypothetical protein
LRAAVDRVAGSTASLLELGKMMEVAAASDMLVSFACLAVMLPNELVRMLPASLPRPRGVEPVFVWEQVWDLPSYESRPPYELLASVRAALRTFTSEERFGEGLLVIMEECLALAV